MEELFNKMGEYTKMDTELPFEEFQGYYQAVMAFLLKDYQELSQDDLIKAKGIVSVMAANAKARALAKDQNRKKFAKMAEKSAFWDDAITRRLTKTEGMSTDELQQKIDALWQ